MNKYFSRITSSQRGEAFNPLSWPFLLATIAYGVSFAFLSSTESVQLSSLFLAMHSLHAVIPLIWGIVAILTILLGFTFLLFRIPPIGKTSGLVGFMLWTFAGFCWAFTGGWVTVFAIAIPNMWFWIWQYLSLSVFRREDARDIATMKAYDKGSYDRNKTGKAERLNNRGVRRQ